MTSESPLAHKTILVVDDEPDILETIAEELDMCTVDKASSYSKGLQFMRSYTYDIVILDIMGVNGFQLLKEAVAKGIPAVMLTAHALSPDALKKSIKLGAVSFLPKEKMSELETYLVDVVMGGGEPVWQKLFNKLGAYFNKLFGHGWKEKDKFFKEFEETFKQDLRKNP